MRRTYIPTVSLSATALMLVVALVCCAPVCARQSGQRVIGPAPVEPGRRSPVEVVSVRVKGEDVAPGRPFAADDDWLRGLTITVKNVSDKPLIFVGLSLRLPNAADKSKSAQMTGPLSYGCWPGFPCRADAKGSYGEIMPGAVQEVELMAANYESFMAALVKVSAALPVESVEYDVDTVFIDADTMWSRGFLFKRDAVKPDEFRMAEKYEAPKRH